MTKNLNLTTDEALVLQQISESGERTNRKLANEPSEIDDTAESPQKQRFNQN